MGAHARRNLRKKIIQLLSDGEIWTTQQIYDACSHMAYGFTSWQQCVAILGQMQRHTCKKISPDFEVVKVESIKESHKSHLGLYIERRTSFYMLQER